VLLAVDEELFTRTGPLTPEVLVVVAFVVDVVPLTTVTGPFTPDVPKVSAACAKGEVSNPRSRTPRITFLLLDTIAT
jgi:hypothetical protein